MTGVTGNAVGVKVVVTGVPVTVATMASCFRGVGKLRDVVGRVKFISGCNKAFKVSNASSSKVSISKKYHLNWFS